MQTITLSLALGLWAAPAMAQTPEAAAPPAAPPAAPVAAPPPAAVPPPPIVATEVKPPTAAEAMPATRPDTLPPIDVGAWARVGSTFQGTSDPKKLNEWKMSSAYVELHAGGKIHKNVGVTLNLNADAGGVNVYSGHPNAAIEDAIIQFDFDDAFHIWAGHLLVPVDRANASGPFFMIPWNYPGIISVGTDTRFYLPNEGSFGRNNGVVVWGDLASNKLTYLAGVFDNGDAANTSPLFSGRLRLALWDTEPGFWGNASFFGDKNMLSVGVGGQYQKMPGATNYSEVNADVLLEKKVPGGGWFTAEGAYYHYGVADGGLSDSAYILAAFATGTMGVGNVQPMARYQWFKIKGDNMPKPMNFDAGISYLVKGPALRVLATYSYTKLDAGVTGNAIQLGAQAIFF